MPTLSVVRRARAKPRGRPFAKGNSGRPKGARNKQTLAFEALLEARGAEILDTLIARAVDGDRSALALCVDRLLAPRRERLVPFPIPDIKTPQDMVAAVAAVATAIGEGELTPGEGAAICDVIERMVHATEVVDLEKRIAAMEGAHVLYDVKT